MHPPGPRYFKPSASPSSGTRCHVAREAIHRHPQYLGIQEPEDGAQEPEDGAQDAGTQDAGTQGAKFVILQMLSHHGRHEYY